MSTSPVAAARAVVVTGAWVESKHDIYLIRGSVGAQALFLPIRRRIKKEKKKKDVTSKIFRRATRPTFLCASPKTNILRKIIVQNGSSSREELHQSEQKSATPTVGCLPGIEHPLNTN